MKEVAFFVGAIGALGGAIAVIALRNAFYSVLALIVHLISLAGLFLLLQGEFIAAAQIVVYAGAVMVLYVFVAAYVGNTDEPLWEPIPGQRFIAPLLGLSDGTAVQVHTRGLARRLTHLSRLAWRRAEAVQRMPSASGGTSSSVASKAPPALR